ncbi:MAG TPA: hypothetical protein VME18_02965 [Acidobacteriaceae bacterium]|nr:hypothetical protein [Acidobacteriaceae bacterium]
MKLTALDESLWALSFSLTALLLVVLVWRARWKQFPVFTAWIAFASGKTILLYTIFRFCGLGHLYARVYWHGLWPEFALQIGVAFELARAALRRNGSWVGDARRLFFVAGTCWVAVSAVLSARIVPPRGAYTAWELRGDLFTSLVLCELLVSISLIANRLRLFWERHMLAITEGLTAWVAVTLIVNALQSYLGTRYFRGIEYFQTYAWIGATAWIVMDLGLSNPNVTVPASRPADGSEEIPDKGRPGMLRPLDLGRLLAFRGIYPKEAKDARNDSPLLPAAHSIDGAQS